MSNATNVTRIFSRTSGKAAKHVALLLAGLMLCFGTASIAQAAPSTAAVEQSQTININSAGMAELAELDGIGQSKAQAIIDYRDSNGSFASIEQLTEVKGIGPATVEKNKTRLSL